MEGFDYKSMISFLCCLKHRPELPVLYRDLKRLIYHYVCRLVFFRTPYKKKALVLLTPFEIQIPANVLHCIRVKVMAMGKSHGCASIYFRVCDASIAELLRDVETRIIDSMPDRKTKRRLNGNNIISVRKRFLLTRDTLIPQYKYVDVNGVYVEGPFSVVRVNDAMGTLTMSVYGATKHHQMWSMNFKFRR